MVRMIVEFFSLVLLLPLLPLPPTTILIPTNQIDNKHINNKKKLLKLSNSPIDKTSRLFFSQRNYTI